LRLRGKGLTLPIYSKLLQQAVPAVRWGRAGLPQSALLPADLAVPYSIHASSTKLLLLPPRPRRRWSRIAARLIAFGYFLKMNNNFGSISVRDKNIFSPG